MRLRQGAAGTSLLAQRAGDVIFGAAVARLALAARQITPWPSIFPRRRCRGSCLPCSPCSDRACRRRPCSPARHWSKPDSPCARSPSRKAWPAATGFRRHPCGVLGACVQILDRLLRAFQGGQHRPGFLPQLADFVDQARILPAGGAGSSAWRGCCGWAGRHGLLGRRLDAKRGRRRRLRPAPPMRSSRIDSAAQAIATCVPDCARKLPVRSSMVKA